MKELLRIIGTAIPGAIIAALCWYYVNEFVPHKGQGILEQQSWPINNIYLCATMGAVLAAGTSIVAILFRQQRGQSFETTARFAGLEYRGTVDSNDLHVSGNPRILSSWSEGDNWAIGHFNGTPIQVVDVTSVRSSSQTDSGQNGGDTTSVERQTVFLMPAADDPFPSVCILRRTMLGKALDLLGLKGLEFRSEDGSSRHADQRLLDQFENSYLVTKGLAVGSAAGVDDHQDAELFEKLEQLIGITFVRQLMEHREWSVEFCPTHVAFWRSGKLVRPQELQQQLSDVVSLRKMLIDHSRDRSAARLRVRGSTRLRLENLAGSLFSIAAFGFGGMVLAFVLYLPIFFTLGRKFPFVGLIWPLIAMAAGATSAFLGSRIMRSRR